LPVAEAVVFEEVELASVVVVVAGATLETAVVEVERVAT